MDILGAMREFAEQEAIGFSEWLTFNGWIGNKNNPNRWYKNQFGYETTSELYKQFKQSK